MSNNSVLASLSDLYKLEQLYRESPDVFTQQLDAALQVHPHAQILKFWHMRLHWAELGQADRARTLLQTLGLVIALGVCASLLMQLPAVFSLDPLWYYPRFVPFILLAILGVYLNRHHGMRQLIRTLIRPLPVAGLVVAFSYALLLPHRIDSASITMALIHLPLVLWCFLGVAFCGEQWRSDVCRLAFVRFNGEVFVYTVLFLLGGVVLSGITVALFQLLGMDIQRWYGQHIVESGLICAPLVATFVYDELLQRQSRIASLLARVFAPLFLVMVSVYLVVMLVSGQSPWTDRDFLISFDGLLLLVLGISVFCISDRNAQRPSRGYDVINFLLIVITQAINLVALSAILYRLAEYGLSPNRVVVIGANILIFVHLSLIIRAFIGVFRGQVGGEALAAAVVRFLPVYAVWALLVSGLLPLAFGFV
jgi:hypothetical protein